jgi:hypothetical protein
MRRRPSSANAAPPAPGVSRFKPRALNAQVAFQATLLNSLQESVIATDAQYRLIFWNRGAEALFGYTAKEAIGQHVDALLVPDDEGERARRLRRAAVLLKRGRWQGQALRRRRDGTLIWTDIVASLMTGPGGVPVGFIAIHRDVTRLREKEDMLQASWAQLRTLGASLLAVREEERTSLSRELHDELGQTLTRLKIDLRWLEDRASSSEHRERTRALVGLVDAMAIDVQRISAKLRPAILDDLGLGAAIESQAPEILARAGCRCRLDLRIEQLDRNHVRDTAVFRIVQEAVTNVVRHARATEARIRASLARGALVVTVEDNGVGIGSDTSFEAMTLGLIGMRERASAVGGQLEVRPGKRAGTIVTLSVPVKKAPKASTHDRRPIAS